MPAGHYTVTEEGYAPAWDAKLRTDVIFRHTGAADVTVGSVEGSLTPTDSGARPPLQLGFDGSAIAAQCGDLLVYRITYLSGSSDFYEYQMSAVVP